VFKGLKKLGHDQKIKELRDYEDEEKKRKKQKKPKKKKNKDGTDEMDLEEPVRQFNFESETEVRISQLPPETTTFVPKWVHNHGMGDRNGVAKGQIAVNSKLVLSWLGDKPRRNPTNTKKRLRPTPFHSRVSAENKAAMRMTQEHKHRIQPASQQHRMQQGQQRR
jgi:hypothetical protein